MGLSEFLKDWFGTGVKKLPPGIEATVRANIPNWSKLSVKRRREEAKKIDARYVEDQLAMQEILAEADSTPRPADYGIKWDFLAKLSELQTNVADIESKEAFTLEDMDRKERWLVKAKEALTAHLNRDPFESNPPVPSAESNPLPPAVARASPQRIDALKEELMLLIPKMEAEGKLVTGTTVMAELKRRAEKEGSCITRDNADGVQWDNGKKPKNLTMSALNERLRRWRKKANDKPTISSANPR